MATFSQKEIRLIDDCFNNVLDFVKNAGEIVKKGFKKESKAISGEKHQPVTYYDLKSEKILIDGLQALYPDHYFIAEESEKSSELTDEPTWIIDPIDGTMNFIHGNPLLCISVAFAIRKEIVIGIIYNPIMNELYTARKGQGAYLNGEPIHSGSIVTIEESIFCYEVTFLAFPVDKIRKMHISQISKFAEIAAGTRCLGSAALTLAYVARGAINAYIVEFLKPWDIAAGALLITEAGGTVCLMDGSPLDIMKGEIICASTAELCDKILNGVEECSNWKVTIEQ